MVANVLVPEVAVQLIQADLSIAREAAIAVLKESHVYGKTVYPEDDDLIVDEALKIGAQLGAAHRPSVIQRLQVGTCCSVCAKRAPPTVPDTVAIKVEEEEVALPPSPHPTNSALAGFIETRVGKYVIYELVDDDDE